MSGTSPIQVQATHIMTELDALRKDAASLAKWLEESSPGIKVAEMVQAFPNLATAIGADEDATTQLFAANKWISLASIANAGRKGNDALTRGTAPSAIFALIMPLITPEQVESVIAAAKEREAAIEAEATTNPETGNEVANGAKADNAVLAGTTAPSPANVAARANGTKAPANAKK